MNFLVIKKKLKKVILNAKYLPQTRLRTCRCCNRLSLIVSFSSGEEAKLCVRCRANLRYEMLADSIRSLAHLDGLDVLELDRRSPLRTLLAGSKTYQRSFYSPTEELGSVHPDGARCEDITRLTFAADSLDMMVSSDVLEHVPDLEAAFREMARVLRHGGFHLFTVPNRPMTQKRAEILANGEVSFLLQPDYHSDPLNPKGILAFWDFGPDAASIFSTPAIEVKIISGPLGKDMRVVWCAKRR